MKSGIWKFSTPKISYYERFVTLPQTYSHDTFVKAYKRWQATFETAKYSCYCANHLTLAFGYNYACERHKAWIIYIKARDGITLSPEEKFFIGIQ